MTLQPIGSHRLCRRACTRPNSTVTDESEQHHGHAGWREGGETHFRLDIVSEAFAGKSRVERHRLVNDILKGAFERGLHALAIQAKAPGESGTWRRAGMAHRLIPASIMSARSAVEIGQGRMTVLT